MGYLNRVHYHTEYFEKWRRKGMKLFRKNVGCSLKITARRLQGYDVRVAEKRLFLRTVLDCLKLFPLTVFIIVPFAELFLPAAVRVFPNLLPSTFSAQKYDCTTLSQNLDTKRRLAKSWQQKLRESKDLDEVFLQTKAKLMRGGYPTDEEIRLVSKSKNVDFCNMTRPQRLAMAKMLGVTSAAKMSPWRLELQLRHHLRALHDEDRCFKWGSVKHASREELVEACQKRGILFHGVTEHEMRQHLDRWLHLSSQNDISLTVLLWIQSFHLEKRVKPNVMKIQENSKIVLQHGNPRVDEYLLIHRKIAERQQQMFNHQLKLLEHLRECTPSEESPEVEPSTKELADRKAKFETIVESFTKDSNRLKKLLNKTEPATQSM